MLFRPALLEGGAEGRLSAGFGCRQPAAASLSAAGPVPESGASSQKWQAAGRQNAAFSQILGAGAFEAAGKPWPTGCGTVLPSGQPGRTAPRDNREGAQIGQKLLPGQELPIFIHAPREGSDLGRLNGGLGRLISIHAPREGSDLSHTPCAWRFLYFYPHSPQGERQWTPGRQTPTPAFLSTLPARGATNRNRIIRPSLRFLSTLPARGATLHPGLCRRLRPISIHAPRKGSDRRLQCPWFCGSDFYPRSPQGERR